MATSKDYGHTTLKDYNHTTSKDYNLTTSKDCNHTTSKDYSYTTSNKYPANKYSNVSLLPLHLLPPHLFTSHGMHLNKNGKTKVANMVINILQKKVDRNNDLDTEKFTKLYQQGTINIVEANMRNIIQQMRSDQSVAFAHTISSDFSHRRNMTAGVAVLYRNEFGRPRSSDYVSKNLTCQKLLDGASVYSLVTKSIYRRKPSLADYDNAFDELDKDFKSRALTTLICSPMGCDLIEPDHFIKNIVKFHKTTKASVFIISSDLQSKRPLRNGLFHPSFLRVMRDAMNKWENNSFEEPLNHHHSFVERQKKITTLMKAGKQVPDPCSDTLQDVTINNINNFRLIDTSTNLSTQSTSSPFQPQQPFQSARPLICSVVFTFSVLVPSPSGVTINVLA